MEEDDIIHNAFYLLLKNKYKNKYDKAISKCCTICVPCINSLRGITITEDFINDHILHENPQNSQYFTSWSGDVYHLKNNKFQSTPAMNYNETYYSASILFREQSLNAEFRRYTIFVLDKAINPRYHFLCNSAGTEVKLDRNILCFKDALEFLDELSHETLLTDLKTDLAGINSRLFVSAEELRETAKDLSRRYWARMMRANTLELQRDARFQNLLIKALTVFVMHHMHQGIYASMIESLGAEDAFVNEKLGKLNLPPTMSVFPGVFNRMHLNSAVDVLSQLDLSEGPWEKFICLRSCLDLVIAESKSTLIGVEMAKSTGDGDIIDTRKTNTMVSMDSLVVILVHVILMARPKRLITDLHYVQNFLWLLSPKDDFFCTLAIFQAAVSVIYKDDVEMLWKEAVGKRRRDEKVTEEKVS